MTQQFRYKSYKRSFPDILSVMQQMLDIQKELEQTDLKQLQIFNQTYYIISKNVSVKIGNGYFSQDHAMTKLDIKFAQYYFDALKDYAMGKKTTPAWQVGFDYCHENHSVDIICLAHGVNAHVNNDLGLALLDVVDTDFKEDFDKVDAIIIGSLGEVISKNTLSPIYKPFMHRLIKRWRKNAWNNFIALKEKTITRDEIEENAYGKGQVLMSITSPSNVYKLIPIL